MIKHLVTYDFREISISNVYLEEWDRYEILKLGEEQFSLKSTSFDKETSKEEDDSVSYYDEYDFGSNDNDKFG